MNKNIINKFLPALLISFCLMTLSSCKKMFDVKPITALDKEQTYRNVFDADAAVWGIYGKTMHLAERWMLLNELRADLLQYTSNADEYMKQLSNHNVTADNPYINPQPFYEVILNCNDALKNFNIMLADKKLKVDEYNQRYSDIAALRSWIYLQLGIHYGTVPYVTEPLENVNDIKNETLFPRLSFDLLLNKLIETVEGLPYKEGYSAQTTLRTTVDQYPSEKFFINKYVLLGELYLWRGKGNDFNLAAQKFKRIMMNGTLFRTGDDQYFNQYRIYQADVVNNNDISVGYIRFRENDITQLIDNNSQGWRSIFARAITDQQFNWEWIWVLPFDKNFSPENPFVKLFSPVGGKYQLKPSQAAMDNWNSQMQRNNFPFDARGRFTVRTIGGQPVVMKYLYNYISPNTGLPIVNLYERNSKWFLYRAATLHLHYAEAANRDRRSKIAYGIINNGIKATFDNPDSIAKTNVMRTYDDEPYAFMARQGDPPGPVYRDEWYRAVGIRGRAYVTNVPLVGDSVIAIENMAINEAALETAYEGQRWGDLLRIALRRDDPAFLADKIYNKLSKDNIPGAEAARAKLMNKNNWYLPFKW